MADRPRGGGTIRVSNLQIERRYVDPDYQLVEHNLERGANGLLRVFSLTPNTAAKPGFHSRVDDGTPTRPKDPELDIDISGVSKAVERDFQKKRKGYIGHRTDRSPDREHRLFDVAIAIPLGRVFEGSVSFNVTFGVKLTMTTTSHVGADGTLIRATPLTHLLQCDLLSN
jgi:hypothetical protein